MKILLQKPVQLIALGFPLALIAYSLLYPLQFILFSHSMVGRIVVFLAILFYTYIDLLYGLLAVAITVLYFQSDTVEHMTSLKDSVNDEFRREYCQHGKLMYKGQEVPSSMIPHVFPFVENTNACHLCNSTCKFSVIEEDDATAKATACVV